MRKAGMNPAIEIDHHGNTSPIANDINPVATKETINFFIFLVNLI